MGTLSYSSGYTHIRNRTQTYTHIHNPSCAGSSRMNASRQRVQRVKNHNHKN